MRMLRLAGAAGEQRRNGEMKWEENCKKAKKGKKGREGIRMMMKSYGQGGRKHVM